MGLMNAQRPADGGIEFWGGIESTVNRVGDDYFTQLERSGHHARAADVTRCIALGIRAPRYPVLWERVAPHNLDDPCWQWADERLLPLREAGIRVIAGLVHHGSGPRYTSLIDPGFSQLFARYARMTAERFPWLDAYTPVNEPLTTARFSGLYGLWYPHGRDERTFKTALLAQCRATVLGMREIRRVHPAAQLVQTEDLGKTFSTARLAYHARFLNELRWLSWDLLCGRVTRGHPLWQWLTESCGATTAELMWFADNPCAPDMLGANHYVTSERFLDQRIANYPACYHGGNRLDVYADIEASRSLAEPTGGVGPLLHEAWERYGIPLAVTEVHIDATREDQLRWIFEVWQAAHAAKNSGVDIRAVAAWALFGTFDWQCLLTEERGYYEAGVFDVRGPQPRETAVGKTWRALASGIEPTHPVLASPGWWRREDRFFCPPAVSAQAAGARPAWNAQRAKPILISGAGGTLGRAFARICAKRGLEYTLLSRREMDIANPASVKAAVERCQPWAIVNAAGYVRVDAAELDSERCYRENTLGPEVLSSVCAEVGLQLMIFSSDLVFDGRRGSPYIETDGPAPLNVYGRSKADAEAAVLRLNETALVIRTSSFFGPWDEYNYLAAVINTLKAGRPFAAANDITVSPTYVPDLVNACLDLLIDAETGIWHLTNGKPITWADFAERAAERARLDRALLQPCGSEALQFAARRPAYSALNSERCALMPTLECAIERYFDYRERHAA